MSSGALQIDPPRVAPVQPRLVEIAARIAARSAELRRDYLERLAATRRAMPPRKGLSCGNIAHAVAACTASVKAGIVGGQAPNIAIVTAYNDMLSAHQPLESYPRLIKAAAARLGATAQVAGGVPAMCDGVTQGQPGMELSLFSRDVIAMATAVSLTHNVFDAALMLGVCDKIVPGLVIGALAFGHLPTAFVPAGPMPSGLPNDEKVRVRQAYAAGEVGREALLEAEMKSYHAPGTCTFYGTANTNQMLMEIMGLHAPGSAFAPPGTPLRDALTEETVRLVTAGAPGVGEMLDARSFVNAIVGLHATGGSTNHLIHLVAMARAAGLLVTWEDFADLATTVPLVARIYPNGSADVNQFHAAGGVAFVIRALLEAGLLFEDVGTVAGAGLAAYAREAVLIDGALTWREVPSESPDPAIVRSVADPFQPTGGLALVTGNLGRGIVKTSAVAADKRAIRAPARVFDSQQAFADAFKAGAFAQDVVVVLRGQGPKANGMPELHGLMPPLGVLQGRGLRVALVTDGRLSGASGKILSALHVTPETAAGGPLSRLRDGDIIRLDAERGVLEAEVPAPELAARSPMMSNDPEAAHGLGRDLFAHFRAGVSAADQGADLLWER
jgi:phosphogluconate dehydratase